MQTSRATAELDLAAITNNYVMVHAAAPRSKIMAVIGVGKLSDALSALEE